VSSGSDGFGAGWRNPRNQAGRANGRTGPNAHHVSTSLGSLVRVQYRTLGKPAANGGFSRLSQECPSRRGAGGHAVITFARCPEPSSPQSSETPAKRKRPDEAQAALRRPFAPREESLRTLRRSAILSDCDRCTTRSRARSVETVRVGQRSEGGVRPNRQLLAAPTASTRRCRRSSRGVSGQLHLPPSHCNSPSGAT
jgi:hypothetical protein